MGRWVGVLNTHLNIIWSLSADNGITDYILPGIRYTVSLLREMRRRTLAHEAMGTPPRGPPAAWHFVSSALRSARGVYRARRLLFAVRVNTSRDRVCGAHHQRTTRRRFVFRTGNLQTTITDGHHWRSTRRETILYLENT